MKGSVLLAWSQFFGYALACAALQGALASPRALGAWTPDLGLVLLLAWSARLAPGRGPIAALLVALARSSLSADPLVVLGAGSLGAVGLFLALKSSLEVDRGLARALVCGLCAYLAGTLAIAARSTVLAAGGSDLFQRGTGPLSSALASGLACLLLAPGAARLPGLRRLRRTRP